MMNVCFEDNDEEDFEQIFSYDPQKERIEELESQLALAKVEIKMLQDKERFWHEAYEDKIANDLGIFWYEAYQEVRKEFMKHLMRK